MKSAIFQDSGLANQTRQARKQPQKKWPRTSSPFVAPASATASPSWNFDDMLSNYTSSGVLPPPLSPSLPPRFAPKESNKAQSVKNVNSDEDVDTDSLPLSLLSPTLPSMFQKIGPPATTSSLAHPLPEKPSTVHSVLHDSPKPVRGNRVRWVDKRDDPSKPRFLLRISFSSSLGAYKKAVRSKQGSDDKKRSSSEEVQGLAISGLVKEQNPNMIPPWPKAYQDFLGVHAKSTKEDTFLSMIVQFDWVLCSAITCDSARTKSHHSRTSQIEAWHDLLTEIPIFVHRIERFIKTNNVSDRKRSCLSFLVGVLAVCKAMILKRVNSQLSNDIENTLRKPTSADEKQSFIELQQHIIRNYHKIEEYFAESQSFFKNSPPPTTVCPKTWSMRASSIPKSDESPLSPSSDAYFLPLGSYSDLGEACAFLYGCLRDFVDVFEIEVGGAGRYQLQSGLPNRLFDE
ncbi:hypothetical protein OXX69_011749 [Metschnikowia pulcherrima]